MDRISNLPDEILANILSCLTTKQSALTSALSQRWLNLWKLVPHLDIDDSVFLHPEEGKGQKEEIRQSFIDFVDSVLARQGDSPIKKVSLKCITGLHPETVNRWIRNVVKRGVSDLNLVTDFSLDDNLGVTLSSGRLRKLTVHATGREGFVIPKSITFDTPNLLYLNYSGLLAEDYPLVMMRNLYVARINLILSEDQIELLRAPYDDLIENDEDEEEHPVLRLVNVLKLMYGIGNVQRLSLLADTLEVLSLLSCKSLPVFKNLKFLGIKSDPERGWQAMPVLIKNSPHLETLFIEGLLHYVTDKCGDACPCISREDKGSSLTSSRVKTIEIHGFRATMKEMDMIKHFLEYFPCLEEMRVYIEENDPTQLKNIEVTKLIVEMFELYNMLSSCNVQLLVSETLDQKWKAQGHDRFPLL